MKKSCIRVVAALTAVLAVGASPLVANAQSFPALPELPNVADYSAAPALPELPNVADYSAAPALPALPALPEFSAAPALPQFPAAPALPQFPAAPALPTVPNVSDFSSKPVIPVAPAIPVLNDFLPDLSPAAPVNPDAPNSYVSFGDSLAANPTALDVMVTRVRNRGIDIEWPNLQPNRCAQDRNNFPSQTAHKTGLRLVDYSCPGATAYVPASPNDAIPHSTFAQQVDQALAEGELDETTKLVSVSIGVNDVYQPNNFESVGQESRLAQYHNTVVPQLNRIKAAAPNARVVMLGLPDQTDGFNHTCATNLLGVVSHWYFPIVSYYQDEVRTQHRDAAAAAGVDFFDMVAEINVPNNNNGCTTNPNRLSAAVFDDAPHNLTFHLTDAGHGYYSDRLASLV